MRGSRLEIELTSYQEELRKRGVGREYNRNTIGIIRKFNRHLEAESVGCTRKATADHVVSFLEEHSRFSASYQRTTMNAVRGFLEYHRNPCLMGFRYRVYGSPSTRREFLNRDRMTKLLETPMSWEESILVMGARLEGMRGSELLRFTAGDAREALRSMEIPIRGKMRPGAVPLRPAFETLLRQYLMSHPKDDQDLLLGFGRNRMCRKLARLSERVGFPVRLRDMRRGFGRDFHDAKVPLEDVAELMRHLNPAMTKHYLCLDRDSKQKAMEKVSYPERSEVPVLLVK